jgi:hypothetical protein
VLLRVFSDISHVSPPLFDKITGWPVVGGVFQFISDWAIVISAIVVCLAIIILYISLKKWYQSRALERLHGWASSAVVKLAQYRQSRAESDRRGGEYDELRKVITRMSTGSRRMLIDANFVDDELRARTKKAIRSLQTVEKKLWQQDVTVFRDLPSLQHNLADIMILAFESSSEEETSTGESK